MSALRKAERTVAQRVRAEARHAEARAGLVRAAALRIARDKLDAEDASPDAVEAATRGLDGDEIEAAASLAATLRNLAASLCRECGGSGATSTYSFCRCARAENNRRLQHQDASALAAASMVRRVGRDDDRRRHLDVARAALERMRAEQAEAVAPCERRVREVEDGGRDNRAERAEVDAELGKQRIALASVRATLQCDEDYLDGLDARLAEAVVAVGRLFESLARTVDRGGGLEDRSRARSEIRGEAVAIVDAVVEMLGQKDASMRRAEEYRAAVAELSSTIINLAARVADLDAAYEPTARLLASATAERDRVARRRVSKIATLEARVRRIEYLLNQSVVG